MKELDDDHIFQAEREWMQRPGGPVVRVLSVNRYDEAGNERIFAYRLPLSDPRPKGFHLSGMTAESIEFYEALPFGQWVEIVYPPIKTRPEQSRVNRIIRRAIRKQAQPWKFNPAFCYRVASQYCMEAQA